MSISTARSDLLERSRATRSSASCRSTSESRRRQCLAVRGHADAVHHKGAHRWLEEALQGGDTVGFSWLTLTAFVRISTLPAVFSSPLTPAEGMAQVTAWLDAPGARLIHGESGTQLSSLAW